MIQNAFKETYEIYLERCSGIYIYIFLKSPFLSNKIFNHFNPSTSYLTKNEKLPKTRS